MHNKKLKNNREDISEADKLVKSILYVLCFCTCLFFFIKVMYL